MTVDQIFEEIHNRALADFNKGEAARRLGHWPSEGEAMDYFLGTPRGVRDALTAVGAEVPFANCKERNSP